MFVRAPRQRTRPPAIKAEAARPAARQQPLPGESAGASDGADTPWTLADELEFLIRTQWLAESEAADRRAVGCAIARVVTQN